MNNLHQQWLESQKYYTKRELIEIFPEAKEYLEKEERKCLIIIDAFEMIVRWKLSMISKIKDEFIKWFNEELLRITDGKILNKWERRLKEVSGFLYPFTFDNKNGKITDSDIIEAKNYPFNNLIEFNKAGFTKCPFHNEKTASLHYYKKNNTIHCFGSCNKTWDTIAFIMETEGIEFIKAVKRLI